MFVLAQLAENCYIYFLFFLVRFLPKECFPPSDSDSELTRENTAQTLTHLLGTSTAADTKISTEAGEDNRESGEKY